MSDARHKQLLAAWILLITTFFWASSFLVMKALVMVQQRLVPDAGSWFLSSLSVVVRFGLAALLLLGWNFRKMRGLTRLEFHQGAGLAIVGGLGLWLQMDGVNYTAASTSAFLTQCYCIFIPLFVALRRWRLPSKALMMSTAMVLIGVAILSRFDIRQMRLGRGELETLLASVFFTAQILWLERPIFRPNNTMRFNIVMFVMIALIFTPLILVNGNAAKICPAYGSGAAIGFTLVLALLCTLVAYSLMNYWQPYVEATQAGLIYCSEPMFTSIFALFMPAWLSSMAGIRYANETLTSHQILGGGLIVGANVLVLVQAARVPKEPAAPTPVEVR